MLLFRYGYLLSRHSLHSYKHIPAKHAADAAQLVVIGACSFLVVMQFCVEAFLRHNVAFQLLNVHFQCNSYFAHAVCSYLYKSLT